MVTASPVLRVDDLDIRVFDAHGAPLIAGDVQQRPARRQERIQQLQQRALDAGFPYALFVDLSSAQLFELSAGEGAPPIFEMPTRELLTAYTSGIAEEKVSWQYLQRLVDTWFRNILFPIPGSPESPGVERLRALGLLSRIEGGEAQVKLGDYF